MEYDERLRVPLRWWVQGTMLVASLWLATVVALPTVVSLLVTGLALAVLIAALLSYGAARVQVEGDEFRAGRARIVRTHLGTVSPLDAEASRRASGVEADARAFLLLRPYLKRAVKVEVTDPADPTPYWLVSTRHPDELARALGGLDGQQPGGPNASPVAG